MIRSCKRCEASFESSSRNKAYCPSCTEEARRPRRCEQCKKTYNITTPARLDSQFCGNACRIEKVLKLKGPAGVKAAAAKRRALGNVEVQCAYVEHGLCVHPDPTEKISVVRSQEGGNHYHQPDCLALFRDGGPGRAHLSKSTERFCATCHRSLGVRFSSYPAQHCRACATILSKGQPKTRDAGEQRPCAEPGCATLIHVVPWQAKASQTGRFFCQDHDGRHARQGAHTVRCVDCNTEQLFYKSRIPVSVDRQTMTWSCPQCRPCRTAWRIFICTYAPCDRVVRRRIDTRQGQDGDHFCTSAHRWAHYNTLRPRGPVCQRRGCGNECARQDAVYCSWACFVEATSGRARRRVNPSKAELRVLTAWSSGVRGIRPLAREAKASVNTVQKLIKAGKIAS